MATASTWWNWSLAKGISFGKWFFSSLKSQWLATVLLIPLGFFALQTHTARQDAKEARAQGIVVDRISKIQDSGKALDLALASYFDSIATLGLAERHLRAPGTYKDIPIPEAQEAVVDARTAARKALADHASDLQRVRGTLDPLAASDYMSALADVNAIVENNANINQTPQNINTLSKLVVSRNALIDRAMAKIG